MEYGNRRNAEVLSLPADVKYSLKKETKVNKYWNRKRGTWNWTYKPFYFHVKWHKSRWQGDSRFLATECDKVLQRNVRENKEKKWSLNWFEHLWMSKERWPKEDLNRHLLGVRDEELGGEVKIKETMITNYGQQGCVWRFDLLGISLQVPVLTVWHLQRRSNWSGGEHVPFGFHEKSSGTRCRVDRNPDNSDCRSSRCWSHYYYIRRHMGTPAAAYRSLYRNLKKYT